MTEVTYPTWYTERAFIEAMRQLKAEMQKNGAQ